MDVTDAETLQQFQTMVQKQPDEDDGTFVARLHEALLSKSLQATTFMPIEDSEALKSITHLRHLLKQLRKVTACSTLEGIVNDIQNAKAMLEQLRKSIKQSLQAKP